jgi:hypothetical protein
MTRLAKTIWPSWDSLLNGLVLVIYDIIFLVKTSFPRPKYHIKFGLSMVLIKIGEGLDSTISLNIGALALEKRPLGSAHFKNWRVDKRENLPFSTGCR